MHAAFAPPVSSKLDMPAEAGGERAAGRRPSDIASFDTLLQASRMGVGAIQSPRRQMAATAASLLADTAVLAVRRGRIETDREMSEEPGFDHDSADAGWVGAPTSVSRDESARTHPAPDRTAPDANNDAELASATSTGESASETDGADPASVAALEASLLVSVQTALPATNPQENTPVASAPSFLLQQGDGVGQSPSRLPAEQTAPQADPRIFATVTGQMAGDGLSSRPASLLVPHAVLADAVEISATGNTAPVSAPATSSAGTSNAASSAASAVIATGAAQATKSTDALSQFPASSVRTPEEAAPPSPSAVASVPPAAEAANEESPQGEQGFSPAAGAHLPVSAREGRSDRSLAAKALPNQVAVHVGKAAKAGLTRVDIALEPASLGKVEVRLDFGHDGKISALFLAESREALEALKADQRTLERALAEAGVKTNSASLDFGLREHGAGTGRPFSGGSTRAGGGSESAINTPEAESPPPVEPPAPPSGERRLDIRA